jgi:hypothetical protein
VDYVNLPAANPNGLFSAKSPPDYARPRPPRPLTGAQKVARVLHAASRGAEFGSLAGLIGGSALRRRGAPLLPADASAATGALIGGVAAGIAQRRQDRARDANLSARTKTINCDALRTYRQTHFDSRLAGSDWYRKRQDALARLVDASRNHLPTPTAQDLPYVDTVETTRDIAKKHPWIRRAGVRAAKVGIGAAGGAYLGKKLGTNAGVAAGAVAGLLFSNPETRATVRLALVHARKTLQHL